MKEGDVNSSFFHKVINKRIKCNEISRVMVNDTWKEEVLEVKQGVLEYFKNHFKAILGLKPTLRADFCDKQISAKEN